MESVSSINSGAAGVHSSAVQAQPEETKPENKGEEAANEDAVVVDLSKPNSESGDTKELTEDEQAEIRELQERDREVRAHEQAHLSALGAYKSGGATYTYKTGPDGKQYAVAGEVPVDVSPAETPEETIRKAETIHRAALAPADPSGADRNVAAQAAALAAQAQAELAKEKGQQPEGEDKKDPSSGQASKIAAYTKNTVPAASTTNVIA